MAFHFISRPTLIQVNYLVVGGGGAGSPLNGGGNAGGGGGEVLQGLSSSFSLTTPYSLSVGLPANWDFTGMTLAQASTKSVFGSLSANAGKTVNYIDSSGASSGNGNLGGKSTFDSSGLFYGGGGGGSGGAGQSASASPYQSGAGGIGIVSTVPGIVGTFGVGGNGQSDYNIPPFNSGAFATGNGGDGGIDGNGRYIYPYQGGNGGSGIIVIQIPSSYNATFTGDLTYTSPSVAGYKTYIITSTTGNVKVTFSYYV